MSTFFSLIIPAYNSEKFISKCLQSVLNQNFSKKKYEIIIVDDASKDATFEICKRFKKKNKIIRILYNKKNSGVSQSRNLGIKSAIGKYIIFLDSDDILKRDSFKNLARLLKNEKLDMVLALQLANPEKKFFNKNKINDLLKYFNDSSNFKAHCWNYILKRNFLIKNKIYFKKIKIFEDQIFVAKILFSVKKFKVYKDTFHIHNEAFNSLSRSMGFIALRSCLEVINEICKMLKVNNLVFERRKFLYGRIYFMLDFLKIYLLVSKKNEIKKISTFIKKNIHNFSILKQDYRNKILHKKILKDIFKIFFLYRNYAEVLFNNFNMREASLVYIFGVGILGRIIGQILKNNNIRTLAFLDNNRYFHNKKCLGLKIINPKYLAKLNAYDLEKLLVIISHKDAISKKKIFNQLKKYGLKDRNVEMIDWKAILG